MSEFEVHQLLIAQRAEFDIATLTYVAVSGFFIALAILSKSNWEQRTRRLIFVTYLLISAFIVIRIAASIVRFGKLSIILESMDPEFWVSNITLQAPTLILRVAVIIVTAWLTVHIINRTGSRGDTA